MHATITIKKNCNYLHVVLTWEIQNFPWKIIFATYYQQIVKKNTACHQKYVGNYNCF